LYYRFQVKKYQDELDSTIKGLNNIYPDYVYFETRPLGLGCSQNTGKPFKEVHNQEAQDLARSSILSMMTPTRKSK
jgi:hypothetical protein